MAQVVQDISDWFWDENFWLPPNATWKDLERDETTFLPAASDLWIPFPMALVMLVCRFFWERYVATPIGRMYKLRETPPTKPVPNETLEKAFKKFHKVLPRDFSKVVTLAKEVGFTTRQVERWWRRRRVVGKPSEMQRFRETTWRFLFYFTIFYYGLYILWDKPWFTDTMHCWYGYPRQHVGGDTWWYYMIQSAFYLSLSMSMCMDVIRKDFVEMVIHHVATLSLLGLSWADNMVRIGTLVLVCHDAVDYWMEGAKLAKYMRYQTLCDVLFIIFTLMWFITRLVIFPVKIISSYYWDAWEYLGPTGIHPWFTALISVLQVLHVIWFYMILRIAYGFITKGEVEKDDRSDSEVETESEDEAICEKNSNGRHKRPSRKRLTNGNAGDAAPKNGPVANNSDKAPKNGPVANNSDKAPKNGPVANNNVHRGNKKDE